MQLETHLLWRQQQVLHKLQIVQLLCAGWVGSTTHAALELLEHCRLHGRNCQQILASEAWKLE